MRKRHNIEKRETPIQKKRRFCRCGAGVEQTPGQCDTPGFTLRNKPALVQDPRGFMKLELPRTNKRILQTSSFMMQSWRANVDLQLLIYNSSPTEPDLDEIAAVTDYVVSYACKGNESSIAEKNNLKDYINSLDRDTDISTTKLARMIMNRTLKTRLISKQEAMVQLAGLDLWICSETIETVSISRSYKLQSEYTSDYDGGMYHKYENRLKKATTTEKRILEPMTLDTFFKYRKQISQRSTKEIIPHYVGGKCVPSWPITYDYARSVLVIYSPWSGAFPIKDEQVMDKFSFHYFNNSFPTNVYLDINRALAKYVSGALFKEPTSSNNTTTIPQPGNNDGTEENDEAIFAASTIPMFDPDEHAGLDFGVDHPWSQPTIKLTDEQNSQVDTWLQTEVIDGYEKQQRQKGLQIPTLHDGTTYELVNAKDDQQKVLSYVLSRVKEWFDQSNNPTYKPTPIRLTITGVAGSGKSFLTNALVTALRRIFNKTDSVMVMAPTGEAAFNAGGTTVHYAQNIKVRGDIQEEMPENQRRDLMERNRNLMCAIVDERGLLSSTVLGKMENNLRQTIYKGRNSNVPWGNIPIIIVIGDDYQLPSVEPGAFSIFSGSRPKSDAERLGREVFLSLGKTVLALDATKRQHETEVRLKRVIEAQRAEPFTAQVRHKGIRNT